MASFVGTFDEFRRYINPRSRNVVNSLPRKHKAEVGKCEHCDSTTATLEAAHVTGRDRNKIIEEILDGFTNRVIVTVDLDVFESKFLAAHEPIEENILVLCRECHTRYYALTEPTSEEVELEDVDTDLSESSLMSNAEITEYLRQNVPRLSDTEITNLQSLDYCKNTFQVNYPVLRSVPINSTIEDIRQAAHINGYNRWSTQRPILRGTSQYLVLTQWTDRHRRSFMKWRKSLDNA